MPHTLYVKFRRTAYAMYIVSFIGNLLLETIQAAFMESMIVVFADGKTVLSAAVTGVLYGYAAVHLCRVMLVARLCRLRSSMGNEISVAVHWDAGSIYDEYRAPRVHL